ncbi:MAG TPA: hypothetical protein VHB79_23000 [Polyangiaceae bacterium]|nr:hypothetical protein [Polyangiaceae bacterium]
MAFENWSNQSRAILRLKRVLLGTGAGGPAGHSHPGPRLPKIETRTTVSDGNVSEKDAKPATGMGVNPAAKGATPELNLSALLDVVLVVLIIFMIVTPMVTQAFWRP